MRALTATSVLSVTKLPLHGGRRDSSVKRGGEVQGRSDVDDPGGDDRQVADRWKSSPRPSSFERGSPATVGQSARGKTVFDYSFGRRIVDELRGRKAVTWV